LNMESLSPEIPEQFTREFIIQNAEYSLGAQSSNWRIWVWRNIELIHLTGDFTTETADFFMNECWSVLTERRQYFPFVISLVDITGFEVQSERFRRYLRNNWEHLLDRNDLQIVFITGKGMKSIIWQSIFVVMGRQDRVRFFSGYKRAFKWASMRISSRIDSFSPIQSEKAKDKELIPGQLTLEWIKRHSHIRLVGNDRRWTITAWRNIIFLKISENWTPDEIDSYVDRLSELPAILTSQWDRIFFVFEFSHMKFGKEDSLEYLRLNWLNFLDREDVRVCIVDESKMRRLMWRSMYTFVRRLDRIRLFADCDDAFGWVRQEIVSHENLKAR
jgi:hypothetical protein